MSHVCGDHSIHLINSSFIHFSILKLISDLITQTNLFSNYILYCLSLVLLILPSERCPGFILLRNLLCYFFIIENQNMELLIIRLSFIFIAQFVWKLILYFYFINFGLYFFIILVKKHFHQIFAKSNLLNQILFQKNLFLKTDRHCILQNQFKMCFFIKISYSLNLLLLKTYYL